MTSARKPAGAPEEARRPAGTPDPATDSAATGVADEEAALVDADRPAPAVVDEEAARMDADLDAMLADVERQRDEYLELAQRTKADFENYRRRAARDAEEAGRRARSSLAAELLPALDSLERALQAAGIDPGVGDGSDPEEPSSREVSAHEALAEGVDLVLRELRGTLARAGVEAFDPVGDRFDPAWHEALSTQPGDGESGLVLETLDKGYRLDGQLIRPARVVVSE
jgi:molecular chaperone GrpE